MIRPQTCPICHKPIPADLLAPDPQQPDQPVGRKLLPFCSARCRQVDLLRWFDGKYAIVEPLAPELLDPELSDFDGPQPPPEG